MNELENDRLVDAVWQALDDMGKDGKCVCGATKALLRVALEPFVDDDMLLDMPLEEAERVLRVLRDVGVL